MSKKKFGSRIYTKGGATVEHSPSNKGPWSPVEPSPTTGPPLTLDALKKAKARLGASPLPCNVICVHPSAWRTISEHISDMGAPATFSIKVRVLDDLEDGAYFSVPEGHKALQWSDDRLAAFLNAFASASEDFEDD